MREHVRDPFCEYRDSNRNARIAHIIHALKTLTNADYKNITRLAKDVAKIVTEFEAKEFVSVNAGDSDMLKPMSHVTLLKNKKYREVLEQAFDFETDVECSNTVSVAEYEALKYRCAGLESKIALLEQTSRNLDAGVGGLEYRVAETANDGVEGDSSDAAFLLDLLDDLKGELHDAIETILPGEENTYRPQPGLYGPFNMIRNYEELEHLQMIRDRIEDRRRKAKVLR